MTDEIQMRPSTIELFQPDFATISGPAAVDAGRREAGPGDRAAGARPRPRESARAEPPPARTTRASAL